jgi:lysyl-tRNA synthetase class 2
MADSDIARQNQLDKLDKIRELGWNPYPASFDKTSMVGDTLSQEGKVVKTAGKLVSFRTHGNIAFADLRDETGKIQLFFKKDLLGTEVYKNLKYLDIGDYLGVEGEVIKTQAGQISIAPTSFTLLSKALLTLPNEWYGLKDTESRYRQRYLDLMLNPEVRERFNIRTNVIRSTRKYLDNLGFWEVETPILQPLYGGANAKPFTTHLNALGVQMYLRIAVELYLKRLIIGGYERVYEIGKDFRNEGMDRTHNPEFTMIEWYEAYANYHRVMDVAEGLFKQIAIDLNTHTKIKVDEKEIDLGGKWPRIEMSKIMFDKLGIDVEKESKENLVEYAKKNKIQLIGGETKGQIIFVIFEHTIPDMLIEPTWIIDYPEDVSPLSKSHPTKPGWVERFEGYIGGKEICDGWSELTDPIVQRERLTKDLAAVREDKEEAQHIDEDFLTAMEYGMPPLGGIGIGIERLCMFFTNTWAIKELTLFPTLKPETSVIKGVEDLNNVELFSLNSEVKEKIPSINIGVAVIKGITIQKNNIELQNEINAFMKSQESLTTEQIGESKEIQSYRKLYKEMGVDWHSRRPSPEALLRRIATKKGVYSINTCVDAYNLIVMKNNISAGAFDLDNLELPVELRFAKDNEEILLLGDTDKTKIKSSELVYSDSNGAFNLDFNYRDAQRTAVTDTTQNIMINIDGVYDISREQVEKTLQEVVNIITKYCGGTVESIGIVSAK